MKQPLKSDIGDKTIFQFFKRMESGQLSPEVRLVLVMMFRKVLCSVGCSDVEKLICSVGATGLA
jgi:hypothetical protein